MVLLRDPTQIVIAADSSGWSPTSTVPIVMCKIIIVHGVAFAAAGLLEDRPSRFDVAQIATKAFSQPGTILQRDAEFRQLIRKPLIRAVERIRRDTPTVFNSELIGKPQALQVVFAGFESGKPIYIADYFSILQEKRAISIGFSKTQCPGDCKGASSSYVFLGESSAIESIINDGRFWTRDMTKNANALVEIEIKNKPSAVAAPVDVMHISSQGMIWQQCKKQCQKPSD